MNFTTATDSGAGMMQPVVDTRGRPLHDLRISVTDRCNFRCTYCMPRAIFNADYPYVPRQEILAFEEIVQVVRGLQPLGLHKVRITGGEPLLRRDVEKLIAMLAALPNLDLALTTNGVLLPRMARKLREAGLHRITISLDALDDDVFRAMSDTDISVDRVLEGLTAAEAAGFTPIKINVVVQRGVNDQQLIPLAERFRHTPHIPRFIEFMDTGNVNGWSLSQVYTAKEILQVIGARYPLEPIAAAYPGEVAKNWRYRDGGGEIGIIASVTRAFCQDCTRLRLSTDGKLYTCLFATEGFDVRTLLRSGCTHEQIASQVRDLWSQRQDRYSEVRLSRTKPQGSKIEMSYIGG